jgi:hypothetical protein
MTRGPTTRRPETSGIDQEKGARPQGKNVGIQAKTTEAEDKKPGESERAGVEEKTIGKSEKAGATE